MTPKVLPAILLGLSLSACAGLGLVAPTSITAVETDAASVRADLATLLNDYPFIKGLALAASLADPGLSPIVNQVLAVMDPTVTLATQALADVNTNVATLKVLVTSLKAQVAALSTTYDSTVSASK